LQYTSRFDCSSLKCKRRYSTVGSDFCFNANDYSRIVQVLILQILLLSSWPNNFLLNEDWERKMHLGSTQISITQINFFRLSTIWKVRGAWYFLAQTDNLKHSEMVLNLLCALKCFSKLEC
jgi:hypothetical protein